VSLYAASVPVFLHYLPRIAALAGKGDLAARLVDGFTAGQNLTTAVGFSLRACCPLAGVAVPPLPDPLAAQVAFATQTLHSLSPADFDPMRRIKHRAGFADLDQSAPDYLHLFALPNFFFHLTMAYAVLRAQGADIGKADFDGLHSYPSGFQFS
jgi:uncharacterized protein